MIAGFFALLQEGLGVIRVFDIRVPVVPSDMMGNKLVTSIDAQSGFWVGFVFRQGLAGVVGGNENTDRIEGNAKLPGGAHLRHGGNIKRMHRQWTQQRPLGIQQIHAPGSRHAGAHWRRY